jgi:hypothetical protein
MNLLQEWNIKQFTQGRMNSVALSRMPQQTRHVSELPWRQTAENINLVEIVRCQRPQCKVAV